MKVKIIYLATMLLLLASKSMADDVGLTVRLNKNIFELDDDFIVEVIIKNNASHDLRILPWNLYDYSWFLIADEEGRILPGRELIIFELDSRFPYKDSYVVLASGEVHAIVLKGKIEKTEHIYTGESYSKDNKSVKFISCDIPLSNVGIYYIQAKFKQSDYRYREAVSKYGFQDMWQGSVVSEKVKFTVSK